MTPTSEQHDRPRTAGELMASPAVTLKANCTVADVAEEMVEKSVGSIILVDDEGIYQGIITETAVPAYAVRIPVPTWHGQPTNGCCNRNRRQHGLR